MKFRSVLLWEGGEHEVGPTPLRGQADLHRLTIAPLGIAASPERFAASRMKKGGGAAVFELYFGSSRCAQSRPRDHTGKGRGEQSGS